jgi:hypothetical protein
MTLFRLSFGTALLVLLGACGEVGGSGLSEDAGHDEANLSAPDAASPTADARVPRVPETPDSTSPQVCSPPGSPEAGPRDGGCLTIRCPGGSVCVETFIPVAGHPARAMCVAIPEACDGTPTCDCMEAVAHDCLVPSGDVLCGAGDAGLAFTCACS